MKISEVVLRAVEKSPFGITTLEVLASLTLCDAFTLKTTLSRLHKAGRIVRLKRGVYSSNPMTDPFICAQNTFNGYLGFSTALYLHKFITEVPFVLTVVTTNTSSYKTFAPYEFRAVALKDKAVGFVRLGSYVVSTRAKTLFDCLYLPMYGVESHKLIAAYREKPLSKTEWREFDSYVKKFLFSKQVLARISLAKKEILVD